MEAAAITVLLASFCRTFIWRLWLNGAKLILTDFNLSVWRVRVRSDAFSAHLRHSRYGTIHVRKLCTGTPRLEHIDRTPLMWLGWRGGGWHQSPRTRWLGVRSINIFYLHFAWWNCSHKLINRLLSPPAPCMLEILWCVLTWWSREISLRAVTSNRSSMSR